MSTTTNLGITKLESGLRQPEVVINDALDALDAAIGGSWSSWTPTLTNLSVGNGTVVARYRQIGKLVVCRLSVVFGSSTSISGSLTVTLPVTRATYGGSAGVTPLGSVRLFDSSAGAAVEGRILNITVSSAAVSALTISGSNVILSALSSTSPFTWATSDEIAGQLIYEAA